MQQKVKPGTNRPHETHKEFANRVAREMRDEAARLESKAQQLKASASVLDGKG